MLRRGFWLGDLRCHLSTRLRLLEAADRIEEGRRLSVESSLKLGGGVERPSGFLGLIRRRLLRYGCGLDHVLSATREVGGQPIEQILPLPVVRKPKLAKLGSQLWNAQPGHAQDGRLGRFLGAFFGPVSLIGRLGRDIEWWVSDEVVFHRSVVCLILGRIFVDGLRTGTHHHSGLDLEGSTLFGVAAALRIAESTSFIRVVVLRSLRSREVGDIIGEALL
mmetsp:Transcript_13169/g.43204  ORF Transcript_13169/g.43204 Transcript_13169/m.43204 type:complete len:220 (+) Transcript_13169:1973-2632(+)